MTKRYFKKSPWFHMHCSLPAYHQLDFLWANDIGYLSNIFITFTYCFSGTNGPKWAGDGVGFLSSGPLASP